ncbi:F-box protein [Cardamine amara subsp. amara]|uniref:F-box protein n=1 Tax=Cardamine amara subsp. amara TaxID=228776 RepID=A0ABD1C899_CARAN
MTTMSDLSDDLVGEILCRVPTTSLRSIRSTCKKWNALSKTQSFAKAIAARQQFLGFMMMSSRVCSLRLYLQGIFKDEHGDCVAPFGSIKEVSIPNQVDIANIFHCDGLLLCVIKGKNSSLLVWNPYLGQTKWIQVPPGNTFNRLYMYSLGYDNNNNHKILSFMDGYDQSYKCEIYNFNFNSWKVLDVNPDWNPKSHPKRRSVSLKGNTYFFARKELHVKETENFLLCFDFTTESFGPRLPLPLCFGDRDSMALSCVREEKLAVLYDQWDIIEIWITTKIEPNAISWSKFLKVDKTRRTGFRNYFSDHIGVASFFIDEEKKLAVIFDIDKCYPPICYYDKAYVIGEDEYIKHVKIREDHNVNKFGSIPGRFGLPVVCSSYVPSLVQLHANQPIGKRESNENQSVNRSKPALMTKWGCGLCFF